MAPLGYKPTRRSFRYRPSHYMRPYAPGSIRCLLWDDAEKANECFLTIAVDPDLTRNFTNSGYIAELKTAAVAYGNRILEKRSTAYLPRKLNAYLDELVRQTEILAHGMGRTYLHAKDVKTILQIRGDVPFSKSMGDPAKADPSQTY